MRLTEAMEQYVDAMRDAGFPRSEAWASIARLAASEAQAAWDDENDPTTTRSTTP